MRKTTSSGARVLFLSLAFWLAATSWAVAQDTPPAEPTSALDGSARSSASEPHTSSSSSQANSEKLTPEQAFESLLTEWEAFETAWLEFYPTLVRWGIEFDVLPAYLDNLERSLEKERAARADERAAAETKAAADAIAIDEARAERDQERRRKEAWRTTSIIGWFLALLGGAIVLF